MASLESGFKVPNNYYNQPIITKTASKCCSRALMRCCKTATWGQCCSKLSFLSCGRVLKPRSTRASPRWPQWRGAICCFGFTGAWSKIITWSKAVTLMKDVSLQPGNRVTRNFNIKEESRKLQGYNTKRFRFPVKSLTLCLHNWVWWEWLWGMSRCFVYIQSTSQSFINFIVEM